MNAQDHTLPNNQLTAQQKSVVSIAALTAFGNLDSLKNHLHAGLDAGLSINEIKEVLVQLYAYCGFPRSLNGINTFRSVMEERKENGINDAVGKEVIPHSNSGDTYEQGRRVLEILTKTKQPKPAPGFGEFTPRIDAFLKEHLFGDIFQSDVLTYQQREFVTIAALASMAGVEPQLQSHIAMGKNTGISEAQLMQTADLIEKLINRTQANTFRKLLSKPELPVIEEGMMVRISEIEIVPAFLKEYNTILKEEAAASVKIEPGVIAIFPMYQNDHPTQVRIIEIYANRAAYQSHLKTPHFQHYKTTTLKMVKSLKLVDMQTLDKETMPEIFRKLK
jgi:alkylhydroperoxidase/carboxymuconolactone decarboxylase family protein YurZ/quinol monooxygenase YgiN